MTALLERTHVATVYGYGTDRRTLVLHDEHGNEVDTYGYYLDQLREEVMEDYQLAGWLEWSWLTASAQDELLRALDDEILRALYLDLPFAREQAQFAALDSIIGFDSLTPLAQTKVDEEVRRRWEENS